MAMVEARIPRAQQRRDYPVPIRLDLLDKDADDNDARLERWESKLDKLNARAWGLMMSTLTATILLALNLVVK